VADWHVADWLLPRSWEAPGALVYYSYYNKDDLALAAAWQCKQAVAGSCAEASSQLDAALADDSIAKLPVSYLLVVCPAAVSVWPSEPATPKLWDLDSDPR
jgi:hypothetical protein